MLKTINVPAWFKNLPSNACLNADEIRKLFGYSQKSKVSELIKRGSLPEPDELKPGFTNHRYLRRVGRVKQLIKQMAVN